MIGLLAPFIGLFIYHAFVNETPDTLRTFAIAFLAGGTFGAVSILMKHEEKTNGY